MNNQNESEVLTQDKSGRWIPATPESYYPSKLELLKCIFGAHTYIYGQKEAMLKSRRENYEQPFGRVQCLVCHHTL